MNYLNRHSTASLKVLEANTLQTLREHAMDAFIVSYYGDLLKEIRAELARRA